MDTIEYKQHWLSLSPRKKTIIDVKAPLRFENALLQGLPTGSSEEMKLYVGNGEQRVRFAVVTDEKPNFVSRLVIDVGSRIDLSTKGQGKVTLVAKEEVTDNPCVITVENIEGDDSENKTEPGFFDAASSYSTAPSEPNQ